SRDKTARQDTGQYGWQRFRKPLLYPAELRDRSARFSTAEPAVHGACLGAVRYWGFRPDSATTSFHIARSLAANAIASSGVLERMRAPATRNRFCIATSAAICFIAPASLSTIGRGVAVGSTKAAPGGTTKSFAPASALVGTSGKGGQRGAEATAPAPTFPDSMAGMVCAAPRNGTCTASSPLRLANNTPDKCGEVPTPGLPKLTFPFCFAQTRNSVTVLAGTCSLATTKTLGNSQVSVAGIMSRSGSYGML